MYRLSRSFLFSLIYLLTSTVLVWAATFAVNTTDDVDDGVCDATHCSLREAINAANVLAGPDTIAFNIPGPGPHTIQPTAGLPTVTDPVTIDGYTQPGASPNTNPTTQGLNTVLMIELDGSLTASDGLTIMTEKSTIRGLVINRFDGFAAAGVHIRSLDATGNRLEGSFIGTDATGTMALGNFFGVLINEASSGNTIGGTTSEARNLISGNSSGDGIQICGAHENLVEGNLIGTDMTGGVALGNRSSGVQICAFGTRNTIGGTVTAARNVISANGSRSGGISIVGDENQVLGNFIGTDVTGTADLGNGLHGIDIEGPAFNNLIGGTPPGAGNLIAFNGNTGISIDERSSGATGNAILANSIFSNTGFTPDPFGAAVGLGIDLDRDGVSPNDEQDGDGGTNNLQNFPHLTSANTEADTTIAGTLNSTPATEFRLEFFVNRECDPSGYGEGETFLGSTSVTTDSSGNAGYTVTFEPPVPSGRFITATATDPEGNTSEFSRCLEVLGLPTPCAADGDVNGDGQVSPEDALIVFQCFLGVRACSPEETRRGDITQDGQLSPADALCIFRQFLGLPPTADCVCFLEP